MVEERSRLCSLIAREHFGDDVFTAVSFLLQRGACSLMDVCTGIKMPKSKVKKILCNLIIHGMVSTSPGLADVVLYSVDAGEILVRARFPKFIHLAKGENGSDIPELIVEFLLLNGSGTKKQVVDNIAERYKKKNEEGTRKVDQKTFAECFNRLISDSLIKRVQDKVVEGNTATGQADNPPTPGVKRKASSKSDELPPEKKTKLTSSAVPGSGEPSEYWCVNIDRFHQIMFDENIVMVAKEKVDVAASTIMTVMLTLTKQSRDHTSESTTSVSLFDIIAKLPRLGLPKLSKQEVQNYLSLLTDEKTCGIVSKTDESGGGMYCVNLRHSAAVLCLSSIESIVQERLGSKACRVFRLLVQKKNLEQKQVGELAMIPFKEVKELLYKLFEERLVKIQELTRAGDFAPSRTFYLFSVDVPQVARLMLAKSYQALANLMSRRESEVKDNKRLLEKNQKIDNILATLAESGEDVEAAMQELDELITPSEKQQLERLKHDLSKLEQAELRVDSTIFLLASYLVFN